MALGPSLARDGARQGCPCRLCGGGRLVHLVCFDEMVIERCLSCRSAFVADPQARKEHHVDGYSARYEQELDPGKAGRCWRLLNHWAGVPAPAASILDVGCGEGAFLDLAKEAGLETSGAEIVPAAAEAAADKGHRIFRGSIDDGDIPGATSFDMVTMWDLLEHLVRPGRALGVVYRSLRPGGRFLAVTPMVDSVFDRAGVTGHRVTAGGCQRLLRMCWTQEHLFRYHPTGVAKVLRRIGFVRVRAVPILLLSLGAEHYAGGKVLSGWTALGWLNRLISRTGVFLVRRLGICNKILILATKPPRRGGRRQPRG